MLMTWCILLHAMVLVVLQDLTTTNKQTLATNRWHTCAYKPILSMPVTFRVAWSFNFKLKLHLMYSTALWIRAVCIVLRNAI